MSEQDDNKEVQKSYAKYAKFMGLLIAAIVTMLLFTYLGNWADKHWQFKRPILTMVGLFIGLAIGFYNLIKGIQKESNNK